MQLAVSELRKAARSANALEKLHALDVAEQRLKDAAWLRPDQAGEKSKVGLQEIARSRASALRELARPAVDRLLDSVEKGSEQREVILEAAGHLLAFLNHYVPDDLEVQAQSARFRQLGGKQQPYTPVQPLSEIYARPE
jgi:hypothetical protein